MGSKTFPAALSLALKKQKNKKNVNVLHRLSLLHIVLIYSILFRLLVWEFINGIYNSNPSRGSFMCVFFFFQFCENYFVAEGKAQKRY